MYYYGIIQLFYHHQINHIHIMYKMNTHLAALIRTSAALSVFPLSRKRLEACLYNSAASIKLFSSLAILPASSKGFAPAVALSSI